MLKREKWYLHELDGGAFNHLMIALPYPMDLKNFVEFAMGETFEDLIDDYFDDFQWTFKVSLLEVGAKHE